MLGILYLEGNGVEKDDKLAASWIKKSAEQGHYKAQYTMAMMFKDGIGVKKDLVLAFALLDVATRDGHAEANNIRRKVEMMLEEQQLKEAKSLAAQWQQSKPITIPMS